MKMIECVLYSVLVGTFYLDSCEFTPLKVTIANPLERCKILNRMVNYLTTLVARAFPPQQLHD